jgi:outer membrane lipoprotein-sorting protein
MGKAVNGMKRLFFISIPLIVAVNLNRAHAQSVDPIDILKTVLAKQNQINDYQVNIEIELDVEFINMPVKHAVMYYKQPEKVKFKSDEFLMLPKRGMNFSLRKILKDDFTSIFTGYEYFDQRRHYIITVIPTKKKSDIVLSTIWVDAELFIISKVENNTRSDGSYIIDFTYGDESNVLPSEMKITFEMAHFNIPLKFIGKPMEIDKQKLKKKEKKTGVVFIRFSNYKVNAGIGDDIFDDDEEHFRR